MALIVDSDQKSPVLQRLHPNISSDRINRVRRAKLTDCVDEKKFCETSIQVKGVTKVERSAYIVDFLLVLYKSMATMSTIYLAWSSYMPSKMKESVSTPVPCSHPPRYPVVPNPWHFRPHQCHSDHGQDDGIDPHQSCPCIGAPSSKVLVGTSTFRLGRRRTPRFLR